MGALKAILSVDKHTISAEQPGGNKCEFGMKKCVSLTLFGAARIADYPRRLVAI